MRVAFISGTSIHRSNLFTAWTGRQVDTRFGSIWLREKDRLAILNRHGKDGVTPPHAINHRANIQGLADLGFTDLVSLNSVGSLREDLPPGSLVSCSDYVSFHPATFSDEVGNYEAPFVSNSLIPEIVAVAPEPVLEGQVYVQMIGPRFETPAEIRIIRSWGDVVGMNMASEADLCREAGLRYHSLCMVDNYANGIHAEPISGERFRALVAQNQEKVNTLFRAMITLFSTPADR